MAQYQSFPGAAGDSRTLDKLKALRLPDLAGRSFMDVGCNEGFFCGFAKFQGAERSVGVDQSRPFIERARRRFSDCEFFQQGWDTLPDGPYDAILLASALHYAQDQAALLHQLVQQLTPDGVLVVELGIVTSTKSEWVKVKRGIDERFFPTMPMLREVLKDYAWKWMGPSVSQSGDPVARHVIHISRKRPLAYLLLQPPAYGKSTIAASLFAPAHVRVISGDHQLGLAAKGKLDVPSELRDALADSYSPFTLDQTIQRVFDAGLGGQLVDMWLQQAGDGDFALDVYVPTAYHATVERLLSQAGYLPVLLRWERVGLKFLPADVLAQQAEDFYLSLVTAPGDSNLPGSAADHKFSPVGFVDDFRLQDGRISLRGWAIDGSGSLPRSIVVCGGGRRLVVDPLEKEMRPDVQRHIGLPHALVGYRCTVEVPGVSSIEELLGEFAVFAMGAGGAEGNAFRIAGPLAKQLGIKPQDVPAEEVTDHGK